MITYIKKYPIKFTLVGLLAVVLGLNYFGFCYRQMRFLSDEEKIRIVVRYILTTEAAMIEYKKSLGTNDERRLQIERNQPGELVPYRDVNEFFALNPNCCQVTTNYISIGGEGDNVSFCGRLAGLKSAVVGVRYFFRYRNEKGIIQTKLVETFPGISNCGEIGWNLG